MIAAAMANGLPFCKPWAPTWKPNHASCWVLTFLGCLLPSHKLQEQEAEDSGLKSSQFWPFL